MAVQAHGRRFGVGIGGRLCEARVPGRHLVYGQASQGVVSVVLSVRSSIATIGLCPQQCVLALGLGSLLSDRPHCEGTVFGGVPQMVRAVSQAPLPVASKARPGGRSLTL